METEVWLILVFQLTKVGLPVNVVNGVNPLGNGMINPTALALLTGQGRSPAAQQQTHEMTVPNELIGCIIGKGGSKVAEIRWGEEKRRTLY